MFTGIVRERGRVVSFEGGDLVVESTLEPETGDSVSVDGICLTVTGREDGRLSFHVVPETTARGKPFGSEVNLEPALRIGDPLGGHYVQGHVDGVGRVRSVDRDGDDVRMRIEAPPEILRYCIDKGSVTIDGVALTITALDEDSFEVALVPHTLEVTTLGSLQQGDEVNLETDVLAKYVERLLPSAYR
jgi:riboflavin synthase alpha subunit